MRSIFNAVRISTVAGLCGRLIQTVGRRYGEDVAVVFCLEKIIIIVQTSRYLQPDVKTIGFEV